MQTTEGFPAHRYFTIRPAGTRKYLHVYRDHYQADARIDLYHKPELGNSQWRFEQVGNSEYVARSRNSGLALWSGRTLLHQTLSYPENPPRWTIEPTTDPRYHRLSRDAASYIALTPSGDDVHLNYDPDADPDDPQAAFAIEPAASYHRHGSDYTDSYEDEPTAYVREIAQSLVSEAAGAIVPGGATAAVVAFNLAFPSPSLSDILERFRQEILRAVDRRISRSIVRQASKQLAGARGDYHHAYWDERIEVFGQTDAHRRETSLDDAAARLDSVARRIQYALRDLAPTPLDATDIAESDDNVHRVQAGLPLYAVGAAELLNVLQEYAMIQAYGGRAVDAEIRRVEREARTHTRYLDMMFEYVLGWRQSAVTLPRSDRIGAPDYPAIELWDQEAARRLFYFSGGAQESVWSGAAYPRFVDYLEHLRHNYSYVTYPYWSAVQRMRSIAEVTAERCRRLQDDQATRNAFEQLERPTRRRAVAASAGGSRWLSAATGPSWSDESRWRHRGWGAERYFRTIRLAEWGAGSALLVGRAETGVVGYVFDGSLWTAIPTDRRWTDHLGWSREAPSYETIRVGHLGGRTALVVGRSRDGIIASRFDGREWTPVDDGPGWSDANGWGQPKHYDTIRLAPLGDGSALLVARGANGIVGAVLHGSTWTSIPGGPAWSNVGGWDQPKHYDTIRLEPIGDGSALLVARGADGIVGSLYRDKSWTPIPDGPRWSDERGWHSEWYYRTIRLAPLGDGAALLVGRAGKHVVGSVFDGSSWTRTPAGPAWSNDQGWTEAKRFDSIRLSPLGDGAALLVGRDVDGIVGSVFHEGKWTAAPAGPRWPDREGWDQKKYYETIRLASLGDGAALLVGRAADGIQAFEFVRGS